MKIEELINLGLSEEDAKKVAEATAEELKGFVPKTRLNEVITERDSLKERVKEADRQLETLKNSSGDVEAMKTQIADLQAMNTTKDEEHAAEVQKIRLDAAVSAALIGARAKNDKAVRALLELEEVEVLEDGTVKGLNDQIEQVKKDNDYMFSNEKTTIKGARVGESGDEDGDTLTLDKFLALSTEEQMKFKSENENWKDLLN